MIGLETITTAQELLDLEELCTSFEKAWRPGPADKVVERYLGQVHESQRPHLVGELVAIECELLRAKGHGPTRDEYYRRFPEWRAEIDSAFESCLANNRESGAQNPGRPERLGDYRIVREIGRGGMGVVYEAVQESLGRRVAVKTLAADPLCHPKHLKRFERETRAVAKLHHTNIVEVYGIGEQDGLHYYAMQLVEGKSLSRIIAELRELSPTCQPEAAKHFNGPSAATATSAPSDPLPPAIGRSGVTQTDCRWAKVAEIGLQVARALSYAHDCGVLHRDIKPANLLLVPQGTVWVTDFGLARLCQEEDDVTRTGDVVGTLRYLPPEALSGQWDERGDVYALGLTLYELLALRPAFGETDRMMLLDQIIRGDRPPSPRTFDPAIPRDLETIVMKAVSLQPADRYQSAGDLADDLSRLLDGEPIAARRAGAPERLWKWSRRKPALAGLIAVVMIGALVGVPALTMLWMSAETARMTAESERTHAVAARRTTDSEKRKAVAARDDAQAMAYASSMQLAQTFIEQSVGSEACPIFDAWLSSGSGVSFRGAKSDSTHSEETTGASPVHRVSANSIDNTSRAPTRSLRDDHRGWEWNYLSQQLDTSLLSLDGHSGVVFHVAVRSDGAQIATVGGWSPWEPNTKELGEVILWDALTGQKQHVLRDQQAKVSGACYDPSGRRLATISMSDQPNGVRGSISIWDTASGDLLHRAPVPPGYPSHLLVGESKPLLPQVQFSPDGNWLLATSSVIQVRSTNTLKTVWRTLGFRATVLPDGAHLLVIGPPESAVFELATGKRVKSLGKLKLPFDFACTLDGKYLSAMLNGGTHVRLWSLPDLSNIRDIATPNVQWGGVSPDGKLVVYGDRSGNLHFLPLDESRRSTRRMGHAGSINHGAFSQDGSRLVTASSDGTARVWNLDAVPSSSRVLETGVWHDGLGDIAFAEDGCRVVHAASCWAKRSGRTIGRLGVSEEIEQQQRIDITHFTHWPRTDLAFSGDGRLLAAPAGEAEPVEAVGYARSGKINVWSSETFELLHTLDVGAREITSVAWSRDATQLAVASYQNERSAISVFDLAGLLGQPSAVGQAVPDRFESNRQANRTLRRAQPNLLSLSINEHRVTAMSFHTTLLAVSTNTGIHVWNVGPTVTNRPELERHISHASSAAFIDFSPAGDRLAAAYQDLRKVRVHDTQSGDVLYEADAPRAVGCVRFSPNGRRIAMVGYDSLVYFCDANRGNRLITLDGAERQVGTISFTPRVIFSPDGRRIATNDWQGRITVWEAEPGPLDRE